MWLQDRLLRWIMQRGRMITKHARWFPKTHASTAWREHEEQS